MPAGDHGPRLENGEDIVESIFNGLGQQVAVFQRYHDSGGQYSIRIDAGMPASGLHYYRMRSGVYYQVRKMMVIR